MKIALRAKGDTANLKRLEDAIQKMNSVVRTDTWNQELNDAKALLNELSKWIAFFHLDIKDMVE